MNLGARYGASSLYGSGVNLSAGTGIGAANATTVGSTIAMTATPVFGLRTGATLPIAASATVPSKLTVCMPLISSVFGLGADKMLPIGLLGDDIRIEITFESLIQSMIYGGSAAPAINWQITNVELELCIIELSDVGMAMVNSVTPFNLKSKCPKIMLF